MGTILLMFSTVLKFFRLAFGKATGKTNKLFRSMSRVNRRVHLLSLGIPMMIFGCVLFGSLSWFFFDDFMYYTAFQRDSTEEISTHKTLSWSEDPTSSGGYDSGVPGYSGLAQMYNGARGGSYYKEYLEIVRDACNGSIMSDGYFDANSSKFPNGRDSWAQIPMYTLMGLNVAETGTNSDGIGPAQVMDVKKYDQDAGYSLYTFNTNFVKAKGLSSCDNGFSLGSKKGGFRTPFQFGLKWFDKYAEMPSGWAPNNALFWPCNLNGYGFSETDVRNGRTSSDKAHGELDALYPPDYNSAACMYAYHNLCRGGTTLWPANLKVHAIPLAVVNMHCSGEGIMSRYTLGGVPSGVTTQDCAVNQWNHLEALFSRYQDYVFEHGDEVGVNWYTQFTWKGWASTLMLLDGGIVRRGEDLSHLKATYNSNGAFAKGALLAYRAYKGREVASSEVAAYYSSLTVTSVNGYDGPGDVIPTNSHPYAIFMYSDTYSNNGRKLLGKFDDQSIYEMGSVHILGPHIYKKVLGLCGVDVTTKECYEDVSGQLLGRIEIASTIFYGASTDAAAAASGGASSGGSGSFGSYPNSYYYGTRKFVSFLPGSLSIATQTSTIYWREIDKSVGVHFGEDYGCSIGTTLAAVADGKIVAAGSATGYGLRTTIEVARGPNEPKMEVLYAHMSRIDVKVGDTVKAGDVIGKSGNTGVGTGAHLHIEVTVYEEINGESLRNTMSYRSFFEGLYCPATGPRVQKVAKKNRDTCIVRSGTGEKLGMMTEVNRRQRNDYCDSNPPQKAGLNYFMQKAFQSWTAKYPGVSVTQPGASMPKSTTTSGGPVGTVSLTDAQIQKVLAAARARIGMKYSHASKDGIGWDCAGLTEKCFEQIGVDLHHQASYQRGQVASVKIQDLKPGDFFFCHDDVISYNNVDSGEKGTARHVGLVTKVNGTEPSQIICIDANKWGNPAKGGRDGVKEEAFSAQYGSKLTVGGDGLWFSRKSSDGKIIYYTFGRYVGKFTR